MNQSAPLRVGINGFGRIGRLVLRAALSNKTIEILAVNDPMLGADHMAYLFEFDSVHGRFDGEVRHCEKTGKRFLLIAGHEIQVFDCKTPAEIPWKDLCIDTVIESSGEFVTSDAAKGHLQAGAKNVLLSAPTSDGKIPTFVFGVNQELYNPATMPIISNASCTTNALAPLVKLLHDNYGLDEGIATTIHAVTASQSVVDGSRGRDWRAGRSVLNNIIPSKTGAAKTVGEVIPSLKGKLSCVAFRVPVNDVSVIDLTCRLQQPATIDQIVALFRKEGGKGGSMEGIIGLANESSVSSDFRGDCRSCVLDAQASIGLNGQFVKLVGYYDNEWAYSLRMVDMLCYMRDVASGGAKKSALAGK